MAAIDTMITAGGTAGGSSFVGLGRASCSGWTSGGGGVKVGSTPGAAAPPALGVTVVTPLCALSATAVAVSTAPGVCTSTAAVAAAAAAAGSSVGALGGSTGGMVVMSPCTMTSGAQTQASPCGPSGY